VKTEVKVVEDLETRVAGTEEKRMKDVLRTDVWSTGGYKNLEGVKKELAEAKRK
jgi:hypothetical protein